MRAAGTRNERLLAVYSLFSLRQPRDFKSTTNSKGNLVLRIYTADRAPFLIKAPPSPGPKLCPCSRLSQGQPQAHAALHIRNNHALPPTTTNPRRSLLTYNTCYRTTRKTSRCFPIETRRSTFAPSPSSKQLASKFVRRRGVLYFITLV